MFGVGGEMNKKKLAVGIVSGIVVLGLILFGVMAAGIGGEASKLDAMMKKDDDAHAQFADVKAELAPMGYDLGATSAATVNSSGPPHSALVYNTWLTLELKFDETGKMHGYHIDRDAKWF